MAARVPDSSREVLRRTHRQYAGPARLAKPVEYTYAQFIGHVVATASHETTDACVPAPPAAVAYENVAEQATDVAVKRRALDHQLADAVSAALAAGPFLGPQVRRLTDAAREYDAARGGVVLDRADAMAATLPLDLKLRVLSFLPLRDLLAWSSTCHFWRAVVIRPQTVRALVLLWAERYGLDMADLTLVPCADQIVSQRLHEGADLRAACIRILGYAASRIFKATGEMIRTPTLRLIEVPPSVRRAGSDRRVHTVLWFSGSKIIARPAVLGAPMLYRLDECAVLDAMRMDRIQVILARYRGEIVVRDFANPPNVATVVPAEACADALVRFAGCAGDVAVFVTRRASVNTVMAAVFQQGVRLYTVCSGITGVFHVGPDVSGFAAIAVTADPLPHSGPSRDWVLHLLCPRTGQSSSRHMDGNAILCGGDVALGHAGLRCRFVVDGSATWQDVEYTRGCTTAKRQGRLVLTCGSVVRVIGLTAHAAVPLWERVSTNPHVSLTPHEIRFPSTPGGHDPYFQVYHIVDAAPKLVWGTV